MLGSPVVEMSLFLIVYRYIFVIFIIFCYLLFCFCHFIFVICFLLFVICFCYFLFVFVILFVYRIQVTLMTWTLSFFASRWTSTPIDGSGLGQPRQVSKESKIFINPGHLPYWWQCNTSIKCNARCLAWSFKKSLLLKVFF